MARTTCILMSGLIISTSSAATPRPWIANGNASCDVTGATWSYLSSGAFEGVPWNNEEGCLYDFTRGKTANTFSFTSPSACRGDPWRKTPAMGTVISDTNGREVELNFMEGAIPIRHHGWVTPDCAFIDMDDGGLYIRGVHPIDMVPHDWLKVATAWVMRSAMITFADGTRHLTPGVPIGPHLGPHYVGQWMRDGFYGISNAWGLVNETVQESFVASAEWMFNHSRADGILPQSCPPNGNCVYGQTCDDKPPARDWQLCQDLDTSSFAVKFASHLWNQMDDTAGAQFYNKWLPVLLKSLQATTKAPDGSGLLWSNITRPMVGYGFQDAETKSGDVLFSSVLYFNATKLIAQMAEKQGDMALAAQMNAEAKKIQAGATAILWNESLGVFMASTGIEKDRIDVWANALAAATGFTTVPQSAAIFQFFKTREKDIFFEGQVRQIPKPQQWESAITDGTIYQNGGYWATPHHHVLPFLAEFDKDMACRLLNDTIASYRSKGIWEWVGPYFPATIVGAPGYTASAADTYFASEQLRCWEN
eukprot:m.266966 g.266966  ORF g.266966 m.266966 type:complete len:535 (-) comp70459_c0_seq1:2-1606(-)